MTENEQEPYSEFGSGVVVCLAKFSEHLMNHMAPNSWNDVESRNESYLKIYGTPERALSARIELWMNGASDHFYELDESKAPQPLIELADLALKIGHGFTGELWTEETISTIRRLWQESCIAVDKMLGVNALWGEW